MSLSSLKGKSTAQNIPSLSFRFNTASDDIIEVKEDDVSQNDVLPNEVESSSVSDEPISKSVSSSWQNSPSSSLDKDCRPSSLPDTSDVPVSSSVDIPVLSTGDETPASYGGTPTSTSSSTSLFSRFSKTVEHKIHEFRSERMNKEKSYSIDDSAVNPAIINKTSITDESFNRTDNRKSSENVTPNKTANVSLTSSPSRKTSLAKDFAEELTNKIPKLAELRNRRSVSREHKTNAPFSLNSILGRDDGILPEGYMPVEDGVIEAGIEAEEDISLFNIIDSVNDQHFVEEKIPLVDNGAESSSVEADSNQSNDQTPEIYLQGLRDKVMEYIPESNAWSKFLGILFIICFGLPLPRFMAGLIFGCTISVIACHCYIKFFLPDAYGRKKIAEKKLKKQQRPVLLDLPSDGGALQYKGWLNKMDSDYCPETYHISLTHSVFVRLQGTKLLLDHPKRKISKHSRHDEDLQCGGFVHHREYDLKGATVMLLPRNLPRRWLWSRKYPICLKLAANTAEGHKETSCRSSPLKTPYKVPNRKECTRETEVEDLVNLESSKSSEAVLSHSKSVDAEDKSLGVTSQEEEDSDSFEEITTDMCTEKTLYFFARADREKDDWYRRFVDATGQKAVDPLKVSPESPKHHERLDTMEEEDETEEANTPTLPIETADVVAKPLDSPVVSFSTYMAQLLYPGISAKPEVAWLNAMTGRLLYDFLHNPYWENKIQERIQRKLSKVHVPHIVGELIVCGIQLGGSVPQLRSVGVPRQDNRGLWCDMEVEYQGNFTMTIETKLDLMKLKKSSEFGASFGSVTGRVSSYSVGSDSPGAGSPIFNQSSNIGLHYTRSSSSCDLLRRDVHFDTDTDDSVESSSEDEYLDESEIVEGVSSTTPGGSRKVMKMVDKVASNKYFQQVTEWKVLQKAMKSVSNKRILLRVTVERLLGTLSVNIPPQPSDRLWYGFKSPPELLMVAQPHVGETNLDYLPFLSDFIQRKLYALFEKVFVLPNMDDLVVPIMSPLLPGQTNMPKPPWDAQGDEKMHPDIKTNTPSTPAN